MSAPQLTSAEKRALKLCASGPLFRCRNGWQAGATPRVSLDVASRLITAGLARIDTRRFRARALVATEAGEAIVSPPVIAEPARAGDWQLTLSIGEERR